MPALVGLVAGLTLADASIVCLALPSILVELETSVEVAAAVIGVYTLVLALSALGAERVRRAAGTRATGAGGAVLFAAAGVWCGLAESVESLLAARALQAAGGGAVLVAAYARLGSGRLWTAVAVFGTAAGPALGGALTQAFDWRAIFLVQAPLALAGAVALAVVPAGAEPSPAVEAANRRERGPTRAAVALALVSAALTAVLFLLVLLLITGWSLSPLGAAAAVTVLPLAAVAASRVPGEAATRAAAGSALLAGGVLALAFVPEASVGWVIVPQLLAGAGMGLALPALAGGLLPERGTGDAARLVALRHLGITAAFVLLAPLLAAQLDRAVERSRERGAALVLDAKLPPLEKIDLAGVLLGDLDPRDPRDALARGFDATAETVDGDPALLAGLRRRADETLVRGVLDAFAPGFALTGLLAAIAAALLVPRGRRSRSIVAGAAGVAAVPVLALALARPALRPEPVVLADPCAERELPGTGGLTGLLQDQALLALDRAACRFGSSREELVLALADPELRARYRERHGVDPGRLETLLLGGLGAP